MLENRKKSRHKPAEEKRVRRSKSAKLEPVEINKAGRVEHMSVEDVLRASDEKYRPLFDNMLNGFAYCRIMVDENDRPIDFIYIDVNNAFEKLTGLKKEDIVGKKVTEAIPGIKEAHPELFDIYSEVALTGKETKFEVFFKPLEIWLTTSVYSPARGYFVVIFENITERKKAAKEIAKLARFPSEDPYPVLRIAKDGTILYSNQASSPILKQWGCKQGEQVSYDWLDLVNEVLSNQKPQETELACDGKVFSLTFAPLRDPDFVNVYGLDITVRKQAEEEREVMIKLLSLINSSNHMLEMMRLVTVFLRDWSDCEAVGVRLVEGEDYPYYVTSGFSDEFVLAGNSLCSVNETGEFVRDSQGRVFLECMCGNIISGRYDPSKPFFTRNGSFWTNSTTDLLAGTTEADRLARTRNRCNTAGYESLALVPLRAGGETVGLLQFNSRQRGRFTPGRISLFERLADNLAIGLAQRRAEQELRTSETKLSEAVKIAKLGHWEYDVADDLFTFNDQFYAIFHTTAEKVGGYTMSSARYAELFVHPDDKSVVRDEIQKALETPDSEFSRQLEHRIIYADGEIGYINVRIFVIKNSQGRTIKTHGVNQDITERKRAEETLKKAENEKATILNTMSELVAYQDAEHRVVWANRTAGESAGSTAEKLLGRYCYEIWHERNKPCANCPIEKVWKTGRLETEEIHSSDGRVWSVRANPVKNKEGNVIGVVEITLDITERKKAEEALQQSEERFRQALENIPDVIVIYDRDLRIRYINQATRRVTNRPKSYFLGKRDDEVWPPEVYEVYLPTLKKAFDSRSSCSLETVLSLPGSGVHELRITCVPVLDERDEVREILGITHDLTESKRAEQAQRESEIRYRELFESMGNGVAVYEAIDDGEDFVFKNLNKAGESIDEIRRADVIGKKVTDAFPGVKEFGLFEVFQRVWRTGKPEHHPVSLYKDKRLAHWIENYVYKLPTGEIVAVYDDVTKRKQVEEKLYDYQDQLKSMASQVSKVQAQERRNIAVEMHDRVSQRLAMAKVQMQIAAKSSTDAEVSDKLHKTAEEIGRVIEDAYSLMVELSNPVLYEIGLKAAVESLLKKRIGPEQKIEYVLEADDDDFKMDNVIRVPLYQAVRELLRNVIKHSRANKVVVSIHKADGKVIVEVKDNGVGFNTSRIEKPDTIKAGGFGLFSTKENIEYINGKLEIKSEPGKGTVATITAPLRYKGEPDSGGK